MNLPENWTITGIEETLLPFENGQTLRQGWSPQCERFPAQTENTWGVLKTTAIQDGEFRPEHNKQLPTSLQPDSMLEVENGDLLLTCAGPRVRCGVICLVRKTRKRLMISGKMYRFRADPQIALSSYLESFLRSHDTKKRIDQMKTGISDSGLNLTLARFKTLRVPLPPLHEQRRIVAKIEELFSELDKGIENLKQARAQLSVYRQALLKHAFEGTLTADWRVAHKNQLESAEQLLVRIRAEREAVYEQQLIEWTNTVETLAADQAKPPRPVKPSAFVAMRSKDVSLLPPLPIGWAYTYLTNVGDLGRGKSKHRPRNAPFLFGGPYPFIQTGDVKAAGRVIQTFDNTYSEVGLKQSKLWPKGTLCITIAANIAQTAFLGFDACFPDSVVGFKAYDGAVGPEFIDLFIRGMRTRIEAYAPATAQKNINLATLENLVVPLAPWAEQNQIVTNLGEQLSVVDQMESDIDANLQKTEALSQSILKKAFAGELVPQDPADEPAGVLLARVRADRAAQSAAILKPARTRGRKPAVA